MLVSSTTRNSFGDRPAFRATEYRCSQVVTAVTATAVRGTRGAHPATAQGPQGEQKGEGIGRGQNDPSVGRKFVKQPASHCRVRDHEWQHERGDGRANEN